MKILIVEDEKELSDSIAAYLKQEGYVCESSFTFENAGEKINLYNYDCILIDITLPGGNGLDLVKHLKERELNSGIIIISAKDSIEDKIKGLELGADDYLAKPFHLSEMNARIKSVIRRRNFDGKKEITLNEIKALPEQGVIYVNEQEVLLTKKEFDLLIFSFPI